MFKKLFVTLILVLSMVFSAIPSFAASNSADPIGERIVELEMSGFEVSRISPNALRVRATVSPNGYIDSNTLRITQGDSYMVDVQWTDGQDVEIFSVDTGYSARSIGTYDEGEYLQKYRVNWGGYSNIFYRVYNRSNRSMRITAEIYFA